MAETRFQVGDRVKARTSGFVPEGTRGVVQHVLRAVWGMYYVQFEGFEHPQLMHTRDLEQADDMPPSDRERTTAAD